MSKIDNQDVAIRVHNIKKDFYLPHEKSSKSLKSIIVNTFKKKNKGADTQHVLRGLSFDIKKGEFFGIVGRNGSGKSTLLKILAQIYQPTSGKVEHFGKLVPFIELGVGFNPELSGRENVYLNGALLGFTREEIAEKYDKIVEFAELEDFMDQKLKNYSSGMQVRLAFSVAIQADADILVLDEVLAVGDEAFQCKCNDYFKQLKDNGKTVILVTHSMENVRKYCNKAMIIRDGRTKLIGSPEDVANEYSLENLELTSSSSARADEHKTGKEYLVTDFKVELLSKKQIDQNDKVVIKHTFTPVKKMHAKVVMDLYNIDDNYYVYCLESSPKQVDAGKMVTITTTFDISQLNNMNLIAHSSICDEYGNLLIFANDIDSPTFMIRRSDYKDKLQSGAIFKDGKNALWQ